MVSTVVERPEHKVARTRRTYHERRRERLSAPERKALLDALRTSASRRKACDMAMVSYRSVETWLLMAEGKIPGREATPWHKRFLAEVRQAEASPLVLMQAKAVARGDVRYMAMRWPDEFSGQPDMVPAATNYVQQNVIIIPADRIPEFARSLARAEPRQVEGTSVRTVDPLAHHRLIEE